MKKIVLTLTVVVYLFPCLQAQNVGVGTNDPKSKLDVSGGVSIGDSYAGTTAAPANGAIIEGSVGIGTASPDSKAALDVSSTTKGMYIPRLTTAQKNTLGGSLTASNKGLLVFDTDLNRTDYWNGTAWKPVGDGIGGPPNGTAGGDLNGSYPNPTVDGLQGRAVSATAPASGQVLKWNGTSWAPAADNNAGGTITSVTATAPIVSSGGNTPNISITAATGSAAGSMSAADKAKLDAATSSNNVSTLVMRDASGNFSAGLINANLNGQWQRIDDRTIAPADISSGYARFGFTSWNNNNSSPYADFLHLRSYTDASGGKDNLVMFRKDQIGMRIYQQAWNSATPYAGYKDVAFQQDVDAGFIKNQSSPTQTANFNISGNGYLGGSVGIGETSPNAPLTIRAASTADQALYQTWRYDANSNQYTLKLKQTVTSGVVRYTFDMINNNTAYNDVLTLDRGSVGIGTVNPSYKLHVAGDIFANGGWFRVSGQNGLYWQDYGVGLYALDATWVRTYNNSSIWAGSGTIATDGSFSSGYGGTGGPTGGAIFAGNVGIGTSSPSTNLDVNGSVRIRGGSPTTGMVLTATDANGNATWKDVSNIGIKYSGSVTAGNWYRIASNSGNRANAEFTLRDYISSGGHSTLKFIAGASYNDASGTSFTVLNHSKYGSVTFTKVRILQNTTYDPQYVEVYVARSGSVDFTISDNQQASGWVPELWTAGSVPSGYSSREYDVDNLFVVGDYDDRLTVTRGGNVGIGTTNPTYTLHVNGRIKSNGINETSDARLKTNITPIQNALAEVLKMRGVTYDWDRAKHPEMKLEEGKQYGLIAQELEKIIPELVSTDKEGWKSIEYSHLVPVLIEAIKAQQEVIEQQKAENNDQGQRLNEQEKKIAQLVSSVRSLEFYIKSAENK